MKMKENLFQLLTIIVGIMSAYYVSILANVQQINNGFVILILIALSIIVWFISNFINERIVALKEEEVLHTYEFERNLNGLWIERYPMADNNNVKYGLIDMSYNLESKSLHLRGSVFESNGDLFANWASQSVYFDSKKKSLLYIYGGEFVDSRLEGNGYGKIDFNSDSGKYFSANGCFEDITTEFKPVNFDLDRLDDSLCKEITGDCSQPIRSFEKKKLIQLYHKYLSNSEKGLI